MRQNHAVVADLRDIAAERRNEETDPQAVAAFNDSRRDLLSGFGGRAGRIGGAGLLAGGIGAAIAALIALPAAADGALDVQILQTASSLEILAVATYGAALTLPFIKDGNKVVVSFAETTMKQHDEHRQAFQAQTKALGGKSQTNPNPKYKAVVDSAAPTLKTPADVVTLAATLETVATETYLSDLNQFTDAKSKAIMASVMGVESQHLATLRAVGALLAGGAPELIAIPVDASKLPAAAGSVAFPEPFEPTTMASPPEEGAIR
jgi:rubrerythrin